MQDFKIDFKKGKGILPENMALVLRSCKADFSAYGGFAWPSSGYVDAPDWEASASCGNGLHGLLDGKGDYSLLCNDWDAQWLVVAVDRNLCVNIDGNKIKYPWGYVIYSGASREALKIILTNPPILIAESTTGDYAHSSTTGNYAHSSTTGSDGIACVLGLRSRVKSSSGPLVAVWHDGKRRRVAVAYPGEKGIKADTWYQLDEKGKFVECVAQ